MGKWQDAYQKASSFVSQFTTTQKLQLITGNDVNTTFTALQFLNGSMGLHDYFYVSAFSQSSALAMTWDKDAMYAQARAVPPSSISRGSRWLMVRLRSRLVGRLGVVGLLRRLGRIRI